MYDGKITPLGIEIGNIYVCKLNICFSNINNNHDKIRTNIRTNCA